MKDEQFFFTDEDDVFDTLNSLYEDLKPSPYSDAPGLNPDLEWGPEDETTSQDQPLEEAGYNSYSVDFQCGDILLAEVFQYGDKINLDHKIRPFLVIYANAYRAYGFQLTTAHPVSLLNYIVDIPNYSQCGLKFPSSFNMTSVVAVDLTRLVRRVGHITEEQKRVLIDKLVELNGNLSELDTYGWYTPEKIDMTIDNLERIRC